jgi:hypothetical protein
MTTRWLKPTAAAVLGLVVGAGTALALQRLPEPPPATATGVATGSATATGSGPATGTGTGPATGTGTGPATAVPGTPEPWPPAPGPPVGERSRAGIGVPGAVPTPPAPADRVLLVWTPGRLPGGLAGRVGRVRGVRAVTVVKGGLVGLAGSVDTDGRPVDRPRPGTTVPLEAIGFDPATYPALLPAAARAAFARLGPGEALLGATSARLRRLGPGGGSGSPPVQRGTTSIHRGPTPAVPRAPPGPAGGDGG